MMQCQNCGEEYDDDALECPSCPASEHMLSSEDSNWPKWKIYIRTYGCIATSIALIGFSFASFFFEPRYFGFFALLGIIFGCCALKLYNVDSEKNKRRYHILSWVIFTLLWGFVGSVGCSCPHREKARQSACMNNQRQLAVAIAIYAQDNQQHLPPVDGIWEKLAPYTGSNKYILSCPTRGIKAGIGYGYNQWLRGQKIIGISNPQAILLTADCDCKNRPHAITTKQDIDPRHGGVFIASFLDGHTAIISPNSQFLLRPITKKAANAKIMPSKNAARSGARQ